MKPPFSIPSVAAMIVGLVLMAIGQIALGAMAFVIGVGLLAVNSMKQGASGRTVASIEGMDPDSRALFVPIKRLVGEIEDLVERNKESSLMRTIGGEARSEAIRIRDQVASALSIRSDLKRARRGAGIAEQELKRLRAELGSASDVERASLKSTLAAREIELHHYATVDESVASIDSAVEQAKAALSEIRARLAVGVTGEFAASGEASNELRESLGRMKALTVSVDEAQQLLKGN